MIEELENLIKDKNIASRIQDGRDWYNKSYSAFYIGIHEQAMAITREAVLNPFVMRFGISFQNIEIKDHFDWFWDVRQLKNSRRLIIEKVLNSPEYIETIYKEFLRHFSIFDNYANSISNIDFSQLTDDMLFEKIQGLHNSLLESSHWSYTVDSFLSDEENDWFVELLKKISNNNLTKEEIEVLTLPAFSSFVNDSELLFLKLVEAVLNNDDKKSEGLSVEYQNRFFWIRTNYKEYKRVASYEILEEAKKYSLSNKNIKDLILKEDSRINDNKVKKELLFKKYADLPDLKVIVRISELFTHFQDKRKEKALRMNTLFYEMLFEIEKRFKIQHPLGFYLTEKEIFGIFKNKIPDWNEIRDRYENGFLSIFSNEECVILSSEKIKKFGLDKIFFKKLENTKEIKGSIAYKGFVKGVVRVCKSVAEIREFKKGEILVANQTTPEYVPAMKKALAFITDQGGITSHAAIISRELRVPCIIGTKIATKVLKDGDLVEVDANNGVVRILNK